MKTAEAAVMAALAFGAGIVAEHIRADEPEAPKARVVRKVERRIAEPLPQAKAELCVRSDVDCRKLGWETQPYGEAFFCFRAEDVYGDGSGGLNYSPGRRVCLPRY